VWAYDIAWMFVLGAVRLITARFAACRTARQAKSVQVVDEPLRLHAAE
jgi:H+-transporting ATPase